MTARKIKPVTMDIPPDYAGQRLDQVLAALFRDYSRTRLKNWIESGHILVSGKQWRPRDVVLGGEHVAITPVLEPDQRITPEDIQLDIVHEDKHLMVVNKPPGLVVHPGAGNPAGTLQNALLHHDKKLAELPRAGIVHRIDKDTSGLLVIARTLPAHTALTTMIAAHDVQREYEAVCVGVMTAGGMIDAPIGRHPTDRIKMSIRANGREAITHFRVIKRFRAHTQVSLRLETGRTHQIRVHLAHIGYPLVGDAVYGKRLLIPRAASEKVANSLRNFHRQALHAVKLEFTHPVTGKLITCKKSMPADMRQLIKMLDLDLKEHAA